MNKKILSLVFSGVLVALSLSGAAGILEEDPIHTSPFFVRGNGATLDDYVNNVKREAERVGGTPLQLLQNATFCIRSVSNHCKQVGSNRKSTKKAREKWLAAKKKGCGKVLDSDRYAETPYLIQQREAFEAAHLGDARRCAKNYVIRADAEIKRLNILKLPVLKNVLVSEIKSALGLDVSRDQALTMAKEIYDLLLVLDDLCDKTISKFTLHSKVTKAYEGLDQEKMKKYAGVLYSPQLVAMITGESAKEVKMGEATVKVNPLLMGTSYGKAQANAALLEGAFLAADVGVKAIKKSLETKKIRREAAKAYKEFLQPKIKQWNMLLR